MTPEPIPAAEDTLGNPNDSIFNPYFYIPENDQFIEYLNRVEDRLTKIRHGLDIDGVKRSLALFEPPVDVMALVKAFASGGGSPSPRGLLPGIALPVLVHVREGARLPVADPGAALLGAGEEGRRGAERAYNTHEHAILDLQLRSRSSNWRVPGIRWLRSGGPQERQARRPLQRSSGRGSLRSEVSQVALMTVAGVLTGVERPPALAANSRHK